MHRFSSVLWSVLLAPAWTQIAKYDDASAAWIVAQRAIAPTRGAQLDSLISLAQSRGGGRIYAGMPSNWGHYFNIGAVPVYIYLEQRNVDAVGFTLRTSSLMTDPEAYFDEDVPGDYATFGVRYILLPIGHAPPVRASLIRTAGPYRLWQVGGAQTSALIQVVDTYGEISATNANLGTQTSSFLRSTWPGRGVYPTIAFAGTAAAQATLTSLTQRVGVAGIVVQQSHDLVDAQSAEATIVARRRAVVLLKVSYDPGWTATVDGRSTPIEMLAPALVGVMVVPGKHRVVFTYHGFGSYGVLDTIAVVTLVAVGVGPAWRRRARGAR